MKAISRRKKILIIIVAVLLSPIVLWFASGSGIGVIKLHLGMVPYDGTHLLYMTDEQLKETMTPEKYEQWKQRTRDKSEQPSNSKPDGQSKSEQENWQNLLGEVSKERSCSNIFKKIWNWQYCFDGNS